MGVVNSKDFGDYIQTSKSGASAVNSLLGFGCTSLGENPTAQIDTIAYINDASASGSVKGYQNVFPFEARMISDETAIMFIYDIARNQKTGSDAETYYYRVDLYAEPEGTSYPCRKFKVAVEVANVNRTGGEIVSITGNLHQVGSFEAGTFDITTNTFTPAV